MAAGAMVPCWSCGAEMPTEHTRCLKCGAVRHAARVGELDTMPGAPLIRAQKRKRISHYDLVPISLRDEYDDQKRERAVRGMAAAEDRRNKFIWACGAGAALTALPVAVPTFLFMQVRADAVLLTGLDLVIGALAGFLTLRVKGGLFQGLFFFALGFGSSVYTKYRLGYPFQVSGAFQPVAIAVLASAVVLSLLVAGTIGMALDEHDA